MEYADGGWENEHAPAYAGNGYADYGPPYEGNGYARGRGRGFRGRGRRGGYGGGQPDYQQDGGGYYEEAPLPAPAGGKDNFLLSNWLHASTSLVNNLLLCCRSWSRPWPWERRSSSGQRARWQCQWQHGVCRRFGRISSPQLAAVVSWMPAPSMNMYHLCCLSVDIYTLYKPVIRWE